MSIKQDHIGDANKMVSSIDWLQTIELERDLTLADWNKAKAMHRVEIIESYASGSNDRLRNTINTNYYNETFGE